MQANILIGACAVNLIDEFPPPYDTECVFKGTVSPLYFWFLLNFLNTQYLYSRQLIIMIGFDHPFIEATMIRFRAGLCEGWGT